MTDFIFSAEGIAGLYAMVFVAAYFVSKDD